MPSVAPVFEKFTVGWISPLPLELKVARAMLDEEYDKPIRRIEEKDGTSYNLGKIGEHYVVMTSLFKMGTNPAGVVAERMLSSFKNIEFILLVGIGGGVPRYGTPRVKEHDIVLGDVVVSTPGHGYGGVLQYDFGRWKDDGKDDLEIRGGHNDAPHEALLSAVNDLRGNGNRASGIHISQIPELLSTALQNIGDSKERNEYKHQGKDRLYRAEYEHPEGCEDKSCEQCCDREQLEDRTPRTNPAPEIHYGPIASSNQLMTSSRRRDHLCQKHGVLCFEMEAAGVSKALVIRGICDYADSHKEKKWQGYAAATAAAYAKLLLKVLPAPKVDDNEDSGVSQPHEILKSIESLRQQEQEQEQGQRHLMLRNWVYVFFALSLLGTFILNKAASGISPGLEMPLPFQETNKQVNLNVENASSQLMAEAVTDGLNPHQAAEFGNVDDIKSWLETDQIDVNLQRNDGSTTLILAASERNAEVVQLLLEIGKADPDLQRGEDKWNALMSATDNEDARIVELLLKGGANPNIQSEGKFSQGPLHLAAQRGFEEVTRLLLEAGADINQFRYDRSVPLHVASGHGNVDVARLLLEAGGADSNIEKRGKYFQGPLHLAALNGQAEVVRLLLDQDGININQSRYDGLMPLHVASMEGHVEVARLLLQAEGADPNIQSKGRHRQGSLHLAAQNGRAEVAKLLLEKDGIDIEQLRYDRSAALQVAAGHGNVEVVRLLLNTENVDLQRRVSIGLTAMELARKNKHYAVVKLLERYRSRDYGFRLVTGFLLG